MATQKHRHIKRVAQHNIDINMGNIYVNPAAYSLGRSVPNEGRLIRSGLERNGMLLTRPVRVVVKPDYSARRAAAIEQARRVMEEAVAQWAAAELKHGQKFS